MTLKKTIKSVLLRTGALRAAFWRRTRSVAVLAYHSVSRDRDAQADRITPGITTPAELFRDHMRLLRKRYHPVTVDEVALWLGGESELPPRSVAVTFDDGYADNYHVAAPIMEEFEIRGAIYLTVDSVRRQALPWFCRLHYLFYSEHSKRETLDDPESGRRWNLLDAAQRRQAFAECNRIAAALTFESRENYLEALEDRFSLRMPRGEGPGMMTFSQARELRERGHVIGSHTFSHANVAHIPEAALGRELDEAHEILAGELGAAPEHFSYPHPALSPQWNDRTLDRTRKLGYKTAVLTREDTVRREADPLLLPRLHVVADADAAALQWKLETAFIGVMT